MHISRIAFLGGLTPFVDAGPELAPHAAIIHARCANHTGPPYSYSLSGISGGPTGTIGGTSVLPTDPGTTNATSITAPLSTGGTSSPVYSTSSVSNSNVSTTPGTTSYPYGFSFPTTYPTGTGLPLSTKLPPYPTGSVSGFPFPTGSGGGGAGGPISTGGSTTPPYQNSSTVDPTGTGSGIGSGYSYGTSFSGDPKTTTSTIDSTSTISTTSSVTSSLTNTGTYDPVSATPSYSANLTSSRIYPTHGPYQPSSYPVWSITSPYPSGSVGTLLPTSTATDPGTTSFGNETSNTAHPTGSSGTSISATGPISTSDTTTSLSPTSYGPTSSSNSSIGATGVSSSYDPITLSYGFLTTLSTSTKYTPTYSTKSMPSEYYYHHRRPHHGKRSDQDGSSDSGFDFNDDRK